MKEGLAFNDDGQRERYVDFDYGEIDEALEECEEKLTPDQRDALLKMFRSVMLWLWQDAMKDPDGLLMRAVVLCWMFCGHLRQHSLSQIAGGFGRVKQSPHRWVTRFKAAFPYIKVPQLKPETKGKR